MFDNQQRERRHAMISQISASIQSAVLSVGRTKEDLKKYTLNIEDTAWRNSGGKPVGWLVGALLCTPASAAVVCVCLCVSQHMYVSCTAGNALWVHCVPPPHKNCLCTSHQQQDEYERVVNELVAKLHKSALQHGQQHQQMTQQQQYGVQMQGGEFACMLPES